MEDWVLGIGYWVMSIGYWCLLEISVNFICHRFFFDQTYSYIHRGYLLTITAFKWLNNGIRLFVHN